MSQKTIKADEEAVADILYSLHSSDAGNKLPTERKDDYYDNHQKIKYPTIMAFTISSTTDKSEVESIITGDESKSESSDDGNLRPNEEELARENNQFQYSISHTIYGSNIKQEAETRPKRMMSCECGAVILARSHWKHSKSQKHIDFGIWKEKLQNQQQQQQQELTQQEGSDDLQQTSSSSSSSHTKTIPATEGIPPPQHNKRQKKRSSLQSQQQQQQQHYYASEPASSSSTSSLSTSTSNSAAKCTVNATAMVPTASSMNHDTVYQMVYPQTMQYPSQQLLHYQQNLFPNQLVWVQHPFYSYPMMLMMPSSSSFAPQTQPLYYMPAAAATTTTSTSTTSTIQDTTAVTVEDRTSFPFLPPDDGK